MKNITLGFEVGTGKNVEINPAHLIVTGLTQEAGKTTTLESLIKRSGSRAIVFRTKIGEKSFLQGTKIPPFFRDRSDWQFIQGLVESTIKEKLGTFVRSKIIQICKQTGGNSLLEFKKKVDERLEEKLSGFEKDILTLLQAYLEIVLPKLQSITFSNELELVEGLNIIDLERFSRDAEVQSLIIQSTAEEVLHKFKNVILVIPEAWKFLPQKRGNPCKLMVEEFIRQGATNNNYIWIDSQDMADIDKVPLKQVSTWILGYQSERNEVKHTLDQIPLPKSQRPKEDDIMTLGTGMFYLATRERTVKVYVQPFWLDDERAKKVAKGELKVSELDAPETITPFKIALKKEESAEQPIIDFQETSKRFAKELMEMRHDFFNKIEDIQELFNKLTSEVFNLKNQPKQDINADEIVSLVLQKMPVNNGPAGPSPINKEEIVSEVLARVPKVAGAVTYKIAPQEALTKRFLEKEKQAILEDVGKATPKAKETLRFIESAGKGMEIKDVCLRLAKTTTGGASQVIRNTINELAKLRLVRKDSHARVFPHLKERIKDELGFHKATDQEVEQVYNHIVMEMLGDKG